MSNRKRGFVFYFDNILAVESLPPDQRGWLLSALCSYADRVWQDTSVGIEEVLDLYPQMSQQGCCGTLRSGSPSRSCAPAAGSSRGERPSPPGRPRPPRTAPSPWSATARTWSWPAGFWRRAGGRTRPCRRKRAENMPFSSLLKTRTAWRLSQKLASYILRSSQSQLPLWPFALL